MRVVHCKRDEYDVYVGRGSEWGNRFSHKEGTKAEVVVGSREEAIACYKRELWARIKSEGEPLVRKLAGLHGKRLGCWCAPKSCHGDVLAAAAEWASSRLRDQPRYDHHTYLTWQRNIRLQAAFAEQAPEPSPAVGTPTPKAKCPVPLGARTVRISSTPDLDPIIPASPSILTEDWFTGFIPRDEAIVDDPDGDEVELVKDELGWYVDVVEHYLAPRRTQDEIEYDEALLEDLQRFDRPAAVTLSQREVAHIEQQRIAIEIPAEARRHYFKRLPKHLSVDARFRLASEKAQRDPQVKAVPGHVEALKQRQLFRERCAAYGLAKPSRGTLELVGRLMGSGKSTYGEVNNVFAYKALGREYGAELAAAKAIGSALKRGVEQAAVESIGGFLQASRAA